jgi:hypothetical protein
MPESCTCGAELPPDALFCHKCGKPQRDIVEPQRFDTADHVEPAPAPPPLMDASVVPEAPVSFRNPVALRISSVAASAGALLSWVPVLNVVLWLGAGYFAAFFYRRRTGHLLNVRAGVRIGWITGVMLFAIVAVFFSGFIVLFNLAGGAQVFQAQFKNATDPNVMDALKMLQNGRDIALLMAQLFVFITCLSMAGGALGAKMVGRGQ